MGLGDMAVVVSLNLCIALASGYVALRYWYWVYTDRGMLRQVPLGTLPLSVALLATGVTVEALFFGSARVLEHFGVADLWLFLPAVLAVRGLMAVSTSMHMLPLWRADGENVRLRVILWTSLLFGTFVVSLLFFW